MSSFPYKHFSLLLFIILTGCGSDYTPYDSGSSGATTGSGLLLDVPVQPQVTWNNIDGKTQMILQFSVRDGSGVPLADTDYDVELKVNNDTLDVESLLKQSAEDLEVNLYFAMVLDASYSMTQHTPPAFEPMKTAARDSYQEVIELWNTRPGNVKFSLIWFDELMNQSQYNNNTNRDWMPDDILSIPEPALAAATKLNSAVNVMTSYLQTEYNNGVFNGPRDQYVMLVFSDGADNYSWFDNTVLFPDHPLVTSSNASYHQFGTATSTLEDAKLAIANHPSLTTHVIGLGSAINSDELGQIATAGNGTFVANPSSENIAGLFQRVMQEFTTIQTRGLLIPLQPGDYDFTLVVKSKLSTASAESSFKFHAGDSGAGVIE